MFPALIGAIVGGGLGGIKHNQDAAEFNRQKELAARTAEWSPWTGLNGMEYMPKQKPNLFNSLLQGSMAGAQMGMGGMGGGGGMGGMGGGAMAGGSQIPSSDSFQMPAMGGRSSWAY